MFRCADCNTPTGPRISPITMVLTTRPREYRVMAILEAEENATEISTFGFEIVKEKKVCPPCAGVEVARVQEPAKRGFEEDLVRPFKTSLCSISVDTLMERTTHHSKKAKADVLVALGLIKGYEQRGGGL